MKPSLYQELSLPKFLEWLMMSWDIMEPIELKPYLKKTLLLERIKAKH